jgi:hypothetical protein
VEISKAELAPLLKTLEVLEPYLNQIVKGKFFPLEIPFPLA